MFTHYIRLTRRGAAGRERSPLLERLLACACARHDILNWRLDAFRLMASAGTSMPAVGAAALYAARGSVAAGTVFMATPVHYVAEMSTVRLPVDGILTLSESEAERLALDFNTLWSDAGVQLLVGGSAELFCLFDGPLIVAACDPEDVLGLHIAEHLPAATRASRVRLLMSEIEMWLFDHAVNRTRLSAGASAVSGLWLWGGGPALDGLPALRGWTAGNDPLFRALGAVTEPPASAGPAVIAIAAQPGTREWHEAESRWLAHSIDELRRGRIARLDISAGNRCFSVGPRWNWRFWRSRRPWWESLQ